MLQGAGLSDPGGLFYDSQGRARAKPQEKDTHGEETCSEAGVGFAMIVCYPFYCLTGPGWPHLVRSQRRSSPGEGSHWPAEGGGALHPSCSICLPVQTRTGLSQPGPVASQAACLCVGAGRAGQAPTSFAGSHSMVGLRRWRNPVDRVTCKPPRSSQALAKPEGGGCCWVPPCHLLHRQVPGKCAKHLPCQRRAKPQVLWAPGQGLPPQDSCGSAGPFDLLSTPCR